MLSGDEAVKNHTSFFKNPQFGFNILSFIYKPSRYFRASLGADIVWTWYQLDKDVLWVPVGSAADHVSILPTVQHVDPGPGLGPGHVRDL